MLGAAALEAIARYALLLGVAYGYPVEFRVEKGFAQLSYKGKSARYRVLELLDPSGKSSGVGLAVPGFEAYSVRVAELGEGLRGPAFRVVFENIPAAVGLDSHFVSPAETDIWVRRFRLAERLVRVEKAPGPLAGLESLGFEVWSTPDELDYVAARGGIAALWYFPLFNRVDFAMEVQEKVGLCLWGELVGEVKRILGL